MYMLNKKTSCLFLAVICFLNFPATAQDAGGPAAVLNDIQDSYIFVFDASVAADEVGARANRLVASEAGRMRHVYTTAVRGFAANMSATAAQRIYDNNPNIAYYEADGLVTLIDGSGAVKPSKKPPGTPGGGGGDSDTPEPQATPWGITRVGGAGDGTGMRAWVIDTGIDFDHTDLNVDVARSANFVLRGKDSAKDGNGHGTHVAGTIAAIDNNSDVVGVAAGASVVAIRVLDNSGSGSISGVVAGVDYVAANAFEGDVANMSLSGNGHWQSLHDAVTAAAERGVLFSLAAGNSSADAEYHEPAHVEHDNVYTISAINSNDNFASFSNWGNPPVDFAAPGVSVTSTQKGGGTTTLSGTSMAAPHVAGLLLLGTVYSWCTANSDPDGDPDPIAHNGDPDPNCP